MSIGENLKRFRENKGLTQCELAEKVGVSQSMINQIERGTKSISVPLAGEISVILDFSLDELYKTS